MNGKELLKYKTLFVRRGIGQVNPQNASVAAQLGAARAQLGGLQLYRPAFRRFPAVDGDHILECGEESPLSIWFFWRTVSDRAGEPRKKEKAAIPRRTPNHSCGATSRSPIGSDSPNIWLCSSPSSSVTSRTMRIQCSGTFCESSTSRTAARWAS